MTALARIRAHYEAQAAQAHPSRAHIILRLTDVAQRFRELGAGALADLAARYAADLEARRREPFHCERFLADLEGAAKTLEREVGLLEGANETPERIRAIVAATPISELGRVGA